MKPCFATHCQNITCDADCVTKLQGHFPKLNITQFLSHCFSYLSSRLSVFYLWSSLRTVFSDQMETWPYICPYSIRPLRCYFVLGGGGGGAQANSCKTLRLCWANMIFATSQSITLRLGKLINFKMLFPDPGSRAKVENSINNED